VHQCSKLLYGKIILSGKKADLRGLHRFAFQQTHQGYSGIGDLLLMSLDDQWFLHFPDGPKLQKVYS